MSVETVTVRGADIFTRAIGSGGRVIVLHGGPGAHHDYLRPQFDAIAPGFTIQYYDQRGGGASTAPSNDRVGWRDHVEDLVELVIYWETSPATIVGYSWGGLLALLFAKTYPALLERLVLVSPAPITAAGRKEFETRFQERMKDPWIIAERAKLRTLGLRESDPDGYKRRMFELSVAPYFKDFQNLRRLTPFRVTARTQETTWESLGDYDIRDDVAGLHVPALVVHGNADPIPIETARETAQLLGAEFVVMEDSGHCPHVEETQRFTQTVSAYLAS